MPTAITSGDRKLLLIAGGVLLVFTVALALLGSAPASQSGQVPSTYSAEPGGARAAYLLLQELQYKVSRWERSPAELPRDPEDAILILANPWEPPTTEELKGLQRFVENGGQVIFTGGRVKTYFPQAKLVPGDSTSEWTTFSADVPSIYTSGAPKIALQTNTTWLKPGADQLPLYGDEQSPVVLSWRVGKGRILWWAAPTPLTNSGITREGNLNFFLNAVNTSSAGEKQGMRIYWDEYFHGERTSLW